MSCGSGCLFLSIFCNLSVARPVRMDALQTKEVAHDGLTELHVVSDMHARKSLMAERASGFVTLPGGLGTLEEMFEVLTWAQLGFHKKPIGLLNVHGFYDQLLGFLNHACAEGFMHQSHRDLLLADNAPAVLLQRMRSYKALASDKLAVNLVSSESVS